jgi:hypothetical protein
MTHPNARWIIPLTVPLALWAPTAGWAQGGDSRDLKQERQERETGAEREHLELRLGGEYYEGDFGTPTTTRIVTFPVTVKYLGDRFDLGVRTSFDQIQTEGGVVLLGGSAAATGTPVRRSPMTESGLGDTVVKGRVYALKDSADTPSLPSLNIFGRVKIPTGDDRKGLSTGEVDYGFGVELDKQLGSFFVFGEVGYTVIGNPRGEEFRNRPDATLGAGLEFSKTLTGTVAFDWSRAIVPGEIDPLDVIATLSYRVSHAVKVAPFVLIGLSRGSPDFGGGLELRYKFWRY